MSKNESSPSYSSITFEQEFKKALKATSLTGAICKFTGALSALLAVGLGLFAFGMGEFAASIYSFAIAALLLVAGAPLIAFGTITNEQRKQTALLALQTWETQRINNPDIGQYLSRNK